MGARTLCAHEAVVVTVASKRRATLAAALAIRGYELRELAGGGGWMIARWDLARPAVSLDEVERFARQVGAPV